jgi:DNA-binding response OmpR family regulator
MALAVDSPTRRRILVIDHDDLLGTLLAASFGDDDVVVRTADSGCVERELEAFTPDVVVIGLSVPSPQRFALLRQLNRAVRSGAVGVTLIPGGKGRTLDAVVAAGDDVYVRTAFDPASIVARALAT